MLPIKIQQSPTTPKKIYPISSFMVQRFYNSVIHPFFLGIIGQPCTRTQRLAGGDSTYTMGKNYKKKEN